MRFGTDFRKTIEEGFDGILETLKKDKERIIDTYMDNCQDIYLSINFSRDEPVTYDVSFTHISDHYFNQFNQEENNE